MRRSIAAAVLACAVMGGVAASGQDAGVATQPAGVLFGQGSRTSPTVRELSIPGKTVTVGKFLPMLKEKLPSFQYVAKEGHWQDFVLPSLSLQNVTASQVVELLKYLVPQFEAEVSPSGDSPSQIWVFRDRPPIKPAFGEEPNLRAFGLNDAVDWLALRKAWASLAADEVAPSPEKIEAARKAALKDVLSLLEAAMAQSSGAGQESSLKLHEETGVLLAKGSREQLDAISQSLDALKQRSDDANVMRSRYTMLDKEYTQMKERDRALQQRIAVLENQVQARNEGRATTTSKNSDTTEKH